MSKRRSLKSNKMDILWAPWREAYVLKTTAGKAKGCVFCSILKERQDAKTFIFERARHAFAVLNIYPFNGGHALVLPNRHVADLSELSDEERRDLLDLLIRVKERMHAAFKPHAFNIGMNLGHLAGAGIPEHLHIHVVPRWSGDVNFMPAIFGTKVMPVSLKKIYKALVDAGRASASPRKKK